MKTSEKTARLLRIGALLQHMRFGVQCVVQSLDGIQASRTLSTPAHLSLHRSVDVRTTPRNPPHPSGGHADDPFRGVQRLR